jgi:hypothetical protein
MTNEQISKQMKEAEDRIAGFDAHDAEAGNCFPIPLHVAVGNVRAALLAGMTGERWDCIADGVVMLMQILDPKKVRK